MRFEETFKARHRQLKGANPNANADVERGRNIAEVEFFDIENFDLTVNVRMRLWPRIRPGSVRSW